MNKQQEKKIALLLIISSSLLQLLCMHVHIYLYDLIRVIVSYTIYCSMKFHDIYKLGAQDRVRCSLHIISSNVFTQLFRTRTSFPVD